MADVEFVIPAKKDELLQGEPGQYTVTNVCNLPELSTKLSGNMPLFCLYSPVTCHSLLPLTIVAVNGLHNVLQTEDM